MTNNLDISTNAMKLFPEVVGEKKRPLELENLNRQKGGFRRIQNTFFRKDPVSALSSTSLSHLLSPQQNRFLAVLQGPLHATQQG